MNTKRLLKYTKKKTTFDSVMNWLFMIVTVGFFITTVLTFTSYFSLFGPIALMFLAYHTLKKPTAYEVVFPPPDATTTNLYKVGNTKFVGNTVEEAEIYSEFEEINEPAEFLEKVNIYKND